MTTYFVVLYLYSKILFHTNIPFILQNIYILKQIMTLFTFFKLMPYFTTTATTTSCVCETGVHEDSVNRWCNKTEIYRADSLNIMRYCWLYNIYWLVNKEIIMEGVEKGTQQLKLGKSSLSKMFYVSLLLFILCKWVVQWAILNECKYIYIFKLFNDHGYKRFRVNEQIVKLPI